MCTKCKTGYEVEKSFYDRKLHRFVCPTCKA
jgi:transposase-like protein